MSALTGMASQDSIPMSNGPAVGYQNGLPVSAAGGIVAANDATPASWVNGMPISAAGELCIAEGGVAASWSGGLPFDAAGRLCVSLNALDHWDQGVPFGAS